MTTLPSIESAVWWAYTISVDSQAVGNLQNFSPNWTKTIDRVREILFATGPKAKEVVPGPTDISATVERIRMFAENLLKAVGKYVVSIEDFNDPFDILESLEQPTGGNAQEVVYHNCLFSDYGLTISTGTTFVLERATIQIATARPNNL